MKQVMLKAPLRHELIGTSTDVCWQRQIRNRQQELHPREVLPRLIDPQVREITADEARPIIMQYEWLGTMGRSVHCVGLYSQEELLGVACFGWPGSPESRDICGKEMRHLAIALERGACVHWAPKNAGSFLISKACKLIAAKHGYRIFYAYSDEDAGEIGTVYQACNWTYIGKGVGRAPGRLREYFVDTDGKCISSRALRHRKLKKKEALALGYQVIFQSPKHKYVWFEGTLKEKKNLRKSMRYQAMPYPKRRDGQGL